MTQAEYITKLATRAEAMLYGPKQDKPK